MTVLSKNFIKVTRGLTKTIMAVRGVEILAVPQLVFQHQEGILHLALTILIQVLETDLVRGTTLNLMQRTREFNAVNVKVSAISKLNMQTL